MSNSMLVRNKKDAKTDETEMKFDKAILAQILRSILGTSKIKMENDNCGTILESNYHFGDDFTTFRLSESLTFFSMDGTGRASQNIALEIQKQLSLPLYAFDTSYCFDIPLQEVTSLEDFEQKIKQGYGVK